LVTNYYATYRRNHIYAVNYAKPEGKTEYKFFNATVLNTGNAVFNFGQGVFNSNEGEWRGIAWNIIEQGLFGVTSVGNLYSINRENGDISLLAYFNFAGDIQDLTFDFSGVAYVAANDNGVNQIFSYNIDFANLTYGEITPTWIVNLNYITTIVRSIAFDTNDYSMYIVDSQNIPYIMRPAEYATEYCIDQSSNNQLVSSAGLAVSVGVTVYSGWQLLASDNNLGFGLMTNPVGNCEYTSPVVLSEETITFSVEYTMYELCAAAAGSPPIPAQIHSSGSNGAPPAFPGNSDATVLTGWASTGVMTLIGAGMVGLCGLFAITIAVNTSKDENTVPLAAALDGDEANAITYDNAIHVANIGAQQNTLFAS